MIELDFILELKLLSHKRLIYTPIKQEENIFRVLYNFSVETIF